MIPRLTRLLQSIFYSGSILSPAKTIAGIVISILVPYLLYAFLGGFGFALLLIGMIWGIVWLVKRNK